MATRGRSPDPPGSDAKASRARNPLRDRLLWASLVLVLATAGLGIAGSLQWLGRSFPGFLVLENGVVASAGLAHWPATASHEIYQHQVVMANGRPIRSGGELLAFVADLPPGSEVDYRFRRNGSELERRIAVRRFELGDYALLFGAYLLNGLTMAGAALGIRYLRGSHPLANATFPLLLASAIWGLSAMDLYGPYRVFRLHSSAEVLLIPGFVATALGFPERRIGTRSHRIALRTAWSVALGLALAYQLGLQDPSAYVRWHLIANLLGAFGAAALVVSQIAHFLRSRSFEARQRIKVLALGTAAAFSLPAAISLASATTGGRAPQNAIAYTAFLFPLALGYAVIRHNLLGVDLLIRRSLVYGGLSAIVTGIYVASAALLDGLVGEPRGEQLASLVPVLSVLALLPLRDRAQQVIDRVFFRSAYDFARTVEAVSSRLAAVAELEVVSEEIEGSLREVLQPSSIALYVRASKQDPFAPVSGEAAGEAGEWEELVTSSGEIWELDDGALLIPFRTQQRLIGFLYLGARENGKRYGGEDRRLLKILANQGAVAVQNALSLGEVQELNRSLEVKVESRTAELAQALDQLQDRNRQLEEVSATDQLTGLRSRRSGTDALAAEMLLARQKRARLSLLLLDLDHFKQVNDRFGHLGGDEVLRITGQLVRATLREGDVACRYGGEELLVILPGAGIQDAAARAEVIRQAVEAATPIPRISDLRITLSAGVAEWRDQESMAGLIERADAALYEAKDAGRNRVAISARFERPSWSHRKSSGSAPEKRPKGDSSRRSQGERLQRTARTSADARRAELARELPLAIERGEIRLAYQPRISLHDGRCLGAEALARWTSPELGVVSPNEFIPLAEDTELIVPLGARLLQQACLDAAYWSADADPDFCVSVNASAIQFRDASFPRHVTDALRDSGLRPQQLELELTERLIVEQSGPSEERIHELHTMGIRFALDDFGAGFSALRCLATFPLSVLKLDRSLIRDVESNPAIARLVRGTTAMAHGLGFGVVAEGVASAECLEVLRALGCDEGQGFWISAGMAASDFEKFLRHRNQPEKQTDDAISAA